MCRRTSERDRRRWWLRSRRLRPPEWWKLRERVAALCPAASRRGLNCCRGGWCDASRRRQPPPRAGEGRCGWWLRPWVESKILGVEPWLSPPWLRARRDVSFLTREPDWEPLEAAPHGPSARGDSRRTDRIRLPARQGTRNRDHARERCSRRREASRAIPPLICAAWDPRAHDSGTAAGARDLPSVRWSSYPTWLEKPGAPETTALPLVCLENDVKARKRCDPTGLWRVMILEPGPGAKLWQSLANPMSLGGLGSQRVNREG